jgi:hypothetical protein
MQDEDAMQDVRYSRCCAPNIIPRAHSGHGMAASMGVHVHGPPKQRTLGPLQPVGVTRIQANRRLFE